MFNFGSASGLNPVHRLKFGYKKKLPQLIQSEAAECGLVCLAMVAGFHGHQVDLMSLRHSYGISMQGATLLDIMQLAEKVSLTSRPLQIEMDDIRKLKTPCILHWDLNHFVVLKSTNARSIVIHDPAIGERRLKLSDVSGHFTGIALELTPTKEFTIKKKVSKLKFSDFWSKITGLGSSLILIFTLSLLLQAFTLVSPYYIQLVIDDVILTGDTSLLTVLAFGFAFVLVFEIITSALRGFTLLHFGSSMNIQLGSNLFHHLIRLPLDYFEKRHMGEIVSRFGSLQQVNNMLTTGVIETIIDGLMTLITLVMIFFYSPMLSMVVLVAVSLYAVFRILMFGSFRTIKEQEIIAKANENSNFMETARAIQTIKLFGTEVKREGQWQNHYADAINKNICIGHFQISYGMVNRLLFGLENIIVIFLAASLVIQGGFSTGMLFAFMAYKNQFMNKIANLIEKLIEFKMLEIHFDRLGDIALSKKEDIGSQCIKQHTITGKISIKNISFSYSETMPEIIKNFSLEIKAGESVAITGPSGCGKSTLLKLMLGLNKLNAGEIKIDEVPLNQLGHSQYRSQISAVMQNDELLSGSVADNIAFFETPLNMELVVYCAELAAIHDDISSMPMGYESLIGDMGSSLSGGQKQRLILARALYKKPKILFMDEATSHLDMGLESDINQAIKSLNITRVIIAHRKETIASADREIKLVQNMKSGELLFET